MILAQRTATEVETDLKKKFDLFLERLLYIDQLAEETNQDCTKVRYEAYQDLLRMVNPDVECASPPVKSRLQQKVLYDKNDDQINTKIVQTVLTMAEDIRDRACDTPSTRKSWFMSKFTD